MPLQRSHGGGRARPELDWEVRRAPGGESAHLLTLPDDFGRLVLAAGSTARPVRVPSQHLSQPRGKAIHGNSFRLKAIAPGQTMRDS